jgi:hypothetical protein
MFSCLMLIHYTFPAFRKCFMPMENTNMCHAFIIVNVLYVVECFCSSLPYTNIKSDSITFFFIVDSICPLIVAIQHASHWYSLTVTIPTMSDPVSCNSPMLPGNIWVFLHKCIKWMLSWEVVHPATCHHISHMKLLNTSEICC